MDSFIGKTQEQATASAIKSGYNYRFVHINGEDLIVTQELNPVRMNFTITNDTISKVELY